MPATPVVLVTRMNDQQSGPGSEQWRGMTPKERGLSTPMIDDIFEALSDWRRRAACRYLAECEDSGIGVERLASVVAEWGQDSGVPDEAATVEAVEDALVETHLPVLDSLGLLDFDERSHAVHYWGIATAEKWADHADAVTRRNEF